jgi:RNA polymerase sigma-70 factor (ECF subfamily)
MDSTSFSLLQRLGRVDDHHAWRRFVDLYSPLIFYWGRSRGLSDANRRFRSWLRTIAVNRATDILRRNRMRAAEPLDDAKTIRGSLESPADLFAEQEYRGLLARRALELMKAEFAERDWRACWRQVVEGQKAAEVARELGITLNMAFLAKSRVLARLRTELAGLFD